MSETMQIFLTGLTVGVLITAAYAVMQAMHAERRHRDEMALLRRSFDPELQNLQDPKPPAVHDSDTGFNSRWVKHTRYHWTCHLNGQKLQYWPVQDKWHYCGTTYTAADGDSVEAFIERRVKEALK